MWQQRGMPGHSIEGRIKAEPAGHFLNGPAQQIHVTTGIVPAHGGVAQAEA
jgi:hypothetical protein